MEKRDKHKEAEYIKVVPCAECVFLRRDFDKQSQLSCSNLKGMIKPTLNGGCSYGRK